MPASVLMPAPENATMRFAPWMRTRACSIAVFIFLCAGYSTHKRFVLGGEECAAPFAGKTLVSGSTDGCSPLDKGETGLTRQHCQGTQVHHGRVQSRL